MDSDDVPNDLKVKQEPEECSDISSMLDGKLKEEIEFCAVQTIKQEYDLENEVKQELVEFNYNYEPGSSNENSVTCTSSFLEYEASSSDMKTHKSGDDNNKGMPMQWFAQKYKETENIEQNCGFIESTMQNENKYFICEICGKRFPIRKTFCAHVLIHEKKVYKCHICGKHLSRSSALKDHLKRHEGIKNYQCNICLKYFLYHSDLKQHLLIHQDIKYECDICGRKMKQKCTIIHHMKTLHISGIKFQCEICKKLFARKFNIQKHMLIHGASSEHQCHICKKYFADLHRLKEHFETHSHVKSSFKCKICSKFFVYKSSLHRHLKGHENIR